MPTLVVAPVPEPVKRMFPSTVRKELEAADARQPLISMPAAVVLPTATPSTVMFPVVPALTTMPSKAEMPIVRLATFWVLLPRQTTSPPPEYIRTLALWPTAELYEPTIRPAGTPE